MNPSVSTPPDTAPSAQTRKVDQLLTHYGSSHTKPQNELIHYIAIPAIMFSLVGLLFTLHPWAAYAFMAASMVYYLRLSLVFLAAMAAVSLAMLAGVQALALQGVLWQICVALFVIAWVFQFIGHKIEGKKPSFFEDIQYLWVGPLFVLSKLFIKLGVRW